MNTFWPGGLSSHVDEKRKDERVLMANQIRYIHLKGFKEEHTRQIMNIFNLKML